MDLLQERPELLDEMMAFDNVQAITASTRVWWKCRKTKCGHHIWEARIHDRISKNSGCPFCAGKKVCDCSCLARLNPKVAAEWHPTKNSCLPAEVSCSSRKRVWWLCPNSQCHHPHEWETEVATRTQGSGCPWCTTSGRMKRVCECNSLAGLFPEIAKEWMPSNDQDPSTVLPKSNMVAWWKCQNCSHEYKRPVFDRTRTDDKCSPCPKCKDIVKTDYTLKNISEYSISRLQAILRDHCVAGRSTKNKDELYRLVSELYADLRIKKGSNPGEKSVHENKNNSDTEVTPLTIDECKTVFTTISQLGAAQCLKIAEKLGITPNNDLNNLRNQIRAQLQKKFDETDEKVGNSESDIENSESKNAVIECDIILTSGEHFALPVRDDGYVNITKLAKLFNKRINNWTRTDEIQDYIKALSSITHKSAIELIVSNRGGNHSENSDNGTYVHRYLAYKFAQWCDPYVGLQIIKWVDELLQTGSVVIGIEKPFDELEGDWESRSRKMNRIMKSQEKLLIEKDNKIKEQDRLIINERESHNRTTLKLQTRIEKLKMKRHHPDLEEGYCFYCHHNGESINTNRFKIGKTKDMNEVLR
jgi:KilA-N domain/Probable Zinc-ribbon domain